VVAADLHINSTVGLICPSVVLDDGGEYRPSKGQRWLWRNWIDFWAEIPKGCWLVINGDLADKDIKLRGYQNVSRNPASIQRMILATMAPALEQAERVFIIRGTGSHVGKSAHLEEEFAKDIGAERTPDGLYSWWSLCLECEGVLFDIAHHASMGRKPWTSPNSLNSLAAELIIQYSCNRGRLPDVVIRSHNHKFAETGLNYPMRVVATPAWQLSTEYASRIGASPADIGGLVFRCHDGIYDMDVRRYTPGRMQPWKILPKTI
jgi:hypothetical protein